MNSVIVKSYLPSHNNRLILEQFAWMQMVRHRSGAHALELIEPSTLESVMSMSLAEGHEIDTISGVLLPTKEHNISINGGEEQATRGVSPARHATSDRATTKASPCSAQKPYDYAATPASSSEAGAAAAETKAKLMDGTVVATPYNPDRPHHFVCREHLLQASSAYLMKGGRDANTQDGPVSVAHLLTIYRPRLERIPRFAKVRCET